MNISPNKLLQNPRTVKTIAIRERAKLIKAHGPESTVVRIASQMSDQMLAERYMAHPQHRNR